MITTNKRFIAILSTAALLLVMPLIAMQFTPEVKWTLRDFLVAAVLLFGTGITLEFVLRKVKTVKMRIAVCGLVLLALFLVWAELAVGIFGSPFAGS
jgi:hypothetical protein